MFTVVDNRYRGEGFAWVVENLPRDEFWKYGIHGTFADEYEAECLAYALNQAWEDGKDA